jgi:hypothetical protein
MRPAVGGLVLICVLANLATIVGFHRRLAVETGEGNWSTATEALAQRVQREPRSVFVVLDWGLFNPVYVLADAPRNVRDSTWDLALSNPGADRRLRTYLSDPATIFVLHGEAHTQQAAPRQALMAEGEASRARLACQTFAQDNAGDPLIELCAATLATGP